MAASASFNGFYHRYKFLEDSGPSANRASLRLVLDGTAQRPFIYRQILPYTVNWIDSVTPSTWKNHIVHYNNGRLLLIFSGSSLAFNPDYSYRYLLFYFATFFCIFLSVILMHFICRDLGMHPCAALFAPVVMILFVPYTMVDTGHYYDWSELTFLALGFWIALRFDWWWILPVAALGAWSKESYLFFTAGLYPLFRVQASRIRALTGTLAACAVAGCVCLLVHARFAHNLGGTVAVHWRGQLQFFLGLYHPHTLFLGESMDQAYGVFTPPILSLFPMLLLIWLVWRGWSMTPLPVRQHAKIVTAINIPLFLLFCYQGEARNLSLMYIALLVLMAANFSQWADSASGAVRPVPDIPS
jgi:hypothetical protein